MLPLLLLGDLPLTGDFGLELLRLLCDQFLLFLLDEGLESSLLLVVFGLHLLLGQCLLLPLGFLLLDRLLLLSLLLLGRLLLLPLFIFLRLCVCLGLGLPKLLLLLVLGY